MAETIYEISNKYDDVCILCQSKFDGDKRKLVTLMCSHGLCSVCHKVCMATFLKLRL